MKKLIYLAAPYTFNGKDTGFEVKNRVLQIDRAAAVLFQAGHFVYSPISHTHPIKEAMPELGGGWEFWRDYDRRMISHCDVIVVLDLPGYENSVGVNAEVQLAREFGKPLWIMCHKTHTITP